VRLAGVRVAGSRDGHPWTVGRSWRRIEAASTGGPGLWVAWATMALDTPAPRRRSYQDTGGVPMDDGEPAARPNPGPTAGPTPRPVVALMHAISRAHVAVYRVSRGRLGRRMGGLPVCLLTTRGRRSGRLRATTLSCFRHDDGLLVVPADAGSGRLPGWYHNLVAEPRVLVQVGPDVRRMRARTADPGERAQLWPRVVAESGVYGQHQERTERPIPVVVLEPLGR
jgi:F420H(2)-dependent quinone reductase